MQPQPIFQELYQKAISKVDLEEIVEEAQHYASEQEEITSKISKWLEEKKDKSGISSPRTIEDVITIVEKVMPKRITKENYEEETNFLLRGTYAHYLRAIAREAWNLKRKE